MINENVEYEFMGFDPEYEIKAFIAAVADKLYFSAPSDSAMKLAIKKSKGVVKASCRIASQVGTFVAEATGKNPIRAIQRLEKRIKHQLDSWKMNRFERTL
jgi:ribosome-associated translation inhibitor RaiA